MRPARPATDRKTPEARPLAAAALSLTLSLASPLPWTSALAQDGTGRVANAVDATAGRRVPQTLNFANALFNQRRYELAAEQYEKVVRDGAQGLDRADALYGLARSKLFLLRYDEARRYLAAFLQESPRHPSAPTARFRLGEAAYLMRDLPAAREALEAYVADHADGQHADAAWPYLGDVRLGLGDSDGARKAYEKALADHPDGPLADRSRYYLARILAAKGEADAALETLAPVLAREGSEWSERARLQAGQVLAAAGRLEEAADTFEAVERASPEGPAAPEARLRRASALANLKRAEEAEPLLAALVADPSTPPALGAQAAFDLGGLQFDRREPARALESWDGALGRFPASNLTPMLLYRSAEALAALDRPAEARARYLKVARDHPRDAWADRALLAAARAALDAREFDAAAELAAQLPARYPGSPLRANAQLIEARAQQAAGRPEKAAPMLRALLESDAPAEVAQAARYDLGAAYKAMGQPEKAAEVLAEVAEAPASPAPVAAGARYALGQARFEAGQFAEAIEPLTGFLEADPDAELAPFALAYLAEAHHRLGDPEAADETLARLAEGWPESESLRRLRLRLGEEAAAAEQHERAASLLRPIAEGPESEWSARARSGLGWSLVALEDFDGAAEAFALAVESGGTSAPEDASMRAWCLERAGRIDDALAAYEKAASDHPETPQAHAARLARGRLLAREGRPAEAADAIAAYLAAAPADAEGLDLVRSEHAYALRDAGREAEAEAAFAALIESSPASAPALAAALDLGVAAVKDGAFDEAARQLEPLVAPDSAASTDQRQTALYWLGRAAVERGDWAGARTTFDRLAVEHPEGPHRDHARFYRAEAAFRADDPDAAEPDFAALGTEGDPAAEPWRATAWLRRVQCLVALKRWAEAIEQADALLAALPDFAQRAEVHYARGRALQSQPAPRFDEALAAYEAALEAAPGTELAARAQFMRGEVHFFARQYHDAEREFLAVALTHAHPKWQAAALLEAGKVAEADGRPADAASSFEKLLAEFPDEPTAEEARTHLDALKR